VTFEEAQETRRLASLLATARCRALAVGLGHGGPGETALGTHNRVLKATEAFNKHLEGLTYNEPVFFGEHST